MSAIANHDAAFLTRLLSLGQVSLSAIHDGEGSALSQAMANRDGRIIALLLDHGASPGPREMMKAVDLNDGTLLRQLLAKGGVVTPRLLNEAARRGYAAALVALAAAPGVNPDSLHQAFATAHRGGFGDCAMYLRSRQLWLQQRTLWQRLRTAVGAPRPQLAQLERQIDLYQRRLLALGADAEKFDPDIAKTAPIDIAYADWL